MVGTDAVPVGEGWARHDASLLLHGPSKIYFAQQGDDRGKYMVRGDDGKFTVCPAPHAASETPVEARAAGASAIRPASAVAANATAGTRPAVDGDRKMERIVVIADMPKTARLALRFPLGFLDSPASMYALFSGLRGSSAAAHWCASQFHQRLMPELAKHVHGWWDAEAEMPEELLYRGSHVGSLAKALRSVLEGLDRELLLGQHGLGGCDAAVGVLVGDNLVVACCGRATATLLFDDAEPIRLLQAGGDVEAETDGGEAAPVPALGRSSDSGGFWNRQGLLLRAKSAWDAAAATPDGIAFEDDVARILRSPDAFSVLGMGSAAPGSMADVRSAYKKLALRVHPDKVRGCDPLDATGAFERLEAASRAVEALLEQDRAACLDLHRIMQFDPFTLRGAAAALKVDIDAEEKDVKKSVDALRTSLGKLQGARDGERELRRALTITDTAAETLRLASKGATPGSAAERLLAEGVPFCSASALGMRDLRGIGGGLHLRTSAWRLGEAMRLSLCAGATADLSAAELQESARLFSMQPKASAHLWVARALVAQSEGSQSSSASAICAAFRDRDDEEEANNLEDGRAAKRQKGLRGPRSLRARHLLMRCAEPGRMLPPDDGARRSRPPARRPDAPVRTPVEAEAEAIALLRDLLEMQASGKDENVVAAEFRKLCQQNSECASAENAGQLCGDLGWISRGQAEAAFEQAAFGLRRFEFSDVVVTMRGVHLIQRIA